MASQRSSWKGAGLVLALFSVNSFAMEEGVFRSLAKKDRPLPSWVQVAEFAPDPPKPLTVFQSAKGYKPPTPKPRFEVVKNESLPSAPAPVPDSR